MKHLVVCATVPVCFPKLPLSELTLTALEDLPFIKGALQKTGLAAGIVDKCALIPLSGLQQHSLADVSMSCYKFLRNKIFLQPC